MCKMVYQSDVDKLVKSHIYNWVKPKIWNKDINDVDWKNVKDTVYLDALACKTAWWKNYDHFTKLFDDVKDAFVVDADTNVFDNGV
tara:strand:+ start:879 stop:1136 length:258 start_codon:yes stop_codon:yes gene_type:complete